MTDGGGVILYDDKTGPGSEALKNPARRIKTDKDASAVALEQIKRHIDAGRAVVTGVSEPANSRVVDPIKQPVTDHFVSVYGYETDAAGKIVGLYAKDNAAADTPEIHSWSVPMDRSPSRRTRGALITLSRSTSSPKSAPRGV